MANNKESFNSPTDSEHDSSDTRISSKSKKKSKNVGKTGFLVNQEIIIGEKDKELSTTTIWERLSSGSSHKKSADTNELTDETKGIEEDESVLVVEADSDFSEDNITIIESETIESEATNDLASPETMDLLVAELDKFDSIPDSWPKAENWERVDPKPDYGTLPLGEDQPSDTNLSQKESASGHQPYISPEQWAAYGAYEAGERRSIPIQPETEERSQGLGLSSFIATATNFLGRRQGKRDVKSRMMRSNIFERPTTPAFENPTPTMNQIPRTGNVERIVDAKPITSVHHPEKIGHTLVAAEHMNENSSRTFGSRLPERAMQRGELLALAKSISVDGVNVHEMYSVKRIDEDGLHRIVVEYLRGGDIKKVISQEVIRQQLRFERDPQLRSTLVETIEERRARSAAARLKSQTIELLDLRRAKDRTEHMAEFVQKELQHAKKLIKNNPKLLNTTGVMAIIVIYLTILIVVLSK